MAGLDDFYRGDVGREIAADLERIGSPVTREDMTRYHATLAEPLRLELPAGTVYNTDAPTQGVASLMILALFARLGVTQAEGFDHIHGLIEATKRALRMRDRVVADPSDLAHALDRCLEPRFIAGEAMKIDRRKAARWPLGYGEGDTIWMGAADASGFVVSYIQSIFWEFGSGCVLPRTGVLMQNRGASFSLQRGAAEHARARPAAVPYAQPGAGGSQRRAHHGLRHHGRRRPAANASRAVHPPRYCSASRSPSAIDRARWVLGRTWGEQQTKLRLESALRRQPGRSACRGRP